MRKYLLALLASLIVAAPLFAQVYLVNAPDTTFGCSLAGTAGTLTQCQAVPAVATQSYYITDIIVQTTTATAGAYAIRSGTGANCASNTAQVFPSSGSGSDRFLAPIAANPTAVINLSTPIRVTAGHAICHIGIVTNTTNIYITGHVK